MTDHQHSPHTSVQTELLELEANALGEHLADIVDRLPISAAPRRIVDLGCGTGAGTFALLSRFPEAHVTAVDGSVEHLHRVNEKACAGGLADRVSTINADLDGAWPELGTPELVWASASLHHLADPDDALRRVHDLLAPGGLFTVVELAGFPRFLPDDAPEYRPGLEARCHAVTEHRHNAHMPHRGADWGPKLRAAGFDVEDERVITVSVEASSNEAVGRYALNALRRLRGACADSLSADDLAAFDSLLDTDSPNSILRRADLAVRTERTVWAARRG